MFDRQIFSSWTESGSKTMTDHAAEKLKKIQAQAARAGANSKHGSHYSFVVKRVSRKTTLSTILLSM